MKNIQQILKKRAGIIGMMCLLTVLLSSCLKDHNNDYIQQTPAAFICAINASPDSPPLDFLLDNNQANGYPIQYGNILDYVAAYTGKRVASFYKSGSNQKIASDTITLHENKYYSLFLSNSVSTPDLLLLKDTLSRPADSMAVVRFVDLSTNAPAVDLGIQGGSVLATNKAYKGYTSFISVKGNTYTFEARQTGTNTVLVSLSNIKLKAGSIYTIWLHGLTGTTDQTRLTLDIQRNAYY